MIKVWGDGAETGLIDRHQRRGTTFAYHPSLSAERAVSVTMPVRVKSWDVPFGLVPIFEMNLPEGALRERLRRAFAKATGTFDDLDLLAIVGRSQLGRLRYTGPHDRLHEDVPFQSVDEILSRRRDGDLFRYLLDKFAVHSGVSGIQPKILVRDEAASTHLTRERASQSFRGATHIVKFWEPAEYPHLAANEFFCLKAAQQCGLRVPPFELAEDASALVIERFDLRPDGSYRGFEDFCVLNGRSTDQKYRGSYETAILKRFGEFSNAPHSVGYNEELFALIALNCALRNGDAHLKNFGVVYDDVRSEVELAPVYDVVTTTVYVPSDGLALTIEGSTQWPNAKALQKLGETRMIATPRKVREIFERVAEAISKTSEQVRRYIREHSQFKETGTRLIAEWELGRRHSLQPQ